MKKQLIPLGLCLLGATAMVLPSVLTKPAVESCEEALDDPITYETPKEVKLSEFKTVRAEEELKIPSQVTLHYINDDAECESRRFYTWVTGYDGIERKPDSISPTKISITLDFAEIPNYANMPSIFFIIKKAGTWAGQSEDVELKYEKFQDQMKDIGDGKYSLELWLIPGEGSAIEFCISEEETRIPKIATAKFMDWKTIHCVSSDPSTHPLWYKVYAFDKVYLNATPQAQANMKEFYLFKQGSPTTSEFDIVLNNTAKINVQYYIESKYPGYEDKPERKCFVSFEYLYKTSRFTQYYTYSGDDLGMTYTKEKTTFKVWSPISANILVKIYDSGKPRSLYPEEGIDSGETHSMYYTGSGVWELTVAEDLKGKYYTYQVTNPGGTNIEAMDPYAKACGVNGVRGYIYDHNAEEANPTGWNNVPYKWDGVSGYDIKTPNELTPYEIHIRDLTMDSSWQGTSQRGTYAAFAEKGTTYSERYGNKDYTVKTGFDHIEELGVNAIQILPMFDHDDDERPGKMKFNWGYNPLNYNCVEGGYATDPEDPLCRIVEFKTLVKNYAENANHTRVIMDVVYNHVSSAASSCFTKIMPKYYFRYDSNWNYTDGSGCSNEVKTEAPMMRKYIVDSLKWWASEYKVKGFRFDLMGLIDTETMAEARKALNNIDPDIYIYGEGWTSIAGYNGDPGTSGADSANVYSMLHPGAAGGYVGAFNDSGRDAVRGGNDHGYGTNNSYPSWGYVAQGKGDGAGKIGAIYDMFQGVHSGKGGNPNQCINYVSCHDNYTVWDQLRYTMAEGGYADRTSSLYDNSGRPNKGGEPAVSEVVAGSIMAHGIVMASNGVAFIQGGEEIYRTKTISKTANETQGIKATPEYDELTSGGAEAYVRPFPDYETYVDPDVRQVEALSTGEVRMYGDTEMVSHNSYKLPDSINSFKWDRKIHVGNTVTYDYKDTWSKMVEVHKTNTKFDYDHYTTAGFSKWEGNGAVGMFNPGGIHIAIFSRDGGTLETGNISDTFKSKGYSISQSDGKYYLNGYRYTIVAWPKWN